MTRTFAEALAALDADAFDVYQPDVVLAGGMLRTRTLAELALARGRWFTPHTWTNGLGLLANLHVAAGVGGGPFIEFPYDPPGWTPERRDAFLAEPIRPGPRRRPARPAAPGPRRHRSTRPRSRGTPRDRRRPPRTDRPPPTGSPARPPSRRATRLFIDGRFVPAASGRTFDDIAGRDGSRHHARRRGRRRGRRPRGRRRPRRRSTTGAGPTSRRPNRKRVLLKLAELDPGEPRRAGAARVARRRQADPRHARRSTCRRRPRPSSGTPRRSTRSTARSARPGRTRCRSSPASRSASWPRSCPGTTR